MKMMRDRRRGFTLVELLVVLTIIGILMAVLLPAVMSGLDAGKVTHCMNNLSQIGKAIPIYAADNKNMLPVYNSGTNRWELALLSYVGMASNVFWCVGDPYPLATGDRISYGANGASGDCPFKRSATGQPALLRDFDDNMGDLILAGDLILSDAAKKPRLGSAPSVRVISSTRMHRTGTLGNFLMASSAVRSYNGSDPLVNKLNSGQGNLWQFFAPP